MRRTKQKKGWYEELLCPKVNRRDLSLNRHRSRVIHYHDNTFFSFLQDYPSDL
jgi:hypothetical protein